ncbi:MAG: HypC/HybG/HupF family hydrogenase formation chaperone [Actinomycetota bacterium]|nr:HypC/HybG/HupF family hydrogenase formation chaperone [Actinomycetota bacterium]
MCLAVPGLVVELDTDGPVPLGIVDFDGTRREVCFASVPDIAVGEYVIVHVGFALARVDEEQALETLQMFRDLGLLEEELGPDPATTTPGAPGIGT